MSAQVPQVEAIFANSKRTQMEISKALANLGFGAWNELEPGKISDGSTGGFFRVCLRLEFRVTDSKGNSFKGPSIYEHLLMTSRGRHHCTVFGVFWFRGYLNQHQMQCSQFKQKYGSVQFLKNHNFN